MRSGKKYMKDYADISIFDSDGREVSGRIKISNWCLTKSSNKEYQHVEIASIDLISGYGVIKSFKDGEYCVIVKTYMDNLSDNQNQVLERILIKDALVSIDHVLLDKVSVHMRFSVDMVKLVKGK